MEIIQAIWPLVGGLTVPLAQWIKKTFPADLPIASTTIVAVLNLATMILLWQILAPSMPFEKLVGLALAAQVTGQFIHATVKTTKKMKNGG